MVLTQKHVDGFKPYMLLYEEMSVAQRAKEALLKKDTGAMEIDKSGSGESEGNNNSSNNANGKRDNNNNNKKFD